MALRHLKQRDRSHRKDVHTKGHCFKYLRGPALSPLNTLYLYTCKICHLRAYRFSKKGALLIIKIEGSIQSANVNIVVKPLRSCHDIQLQDLLK